MRSAWRSRSGTSAARVSPSASASSSTARTAGPRSPALRCPPWSDGSGGTLGRMPVRLPLFPLNTVLFPHMPAGLHVFEDRYREMIRDCREQGTSFGVVGIREGLEVGAGALTFGVGTLAQIRELDALDDGGFNLIVAGA